MVSKRELLNRIKALENRTSRYWEDILQQERLIEALAEEIGYDIVYKKGMYLEPSSVEEYGDE